MLTMIDAVSSWNRERVPVRECVRPIAPSKNACESQIANLLQKFVSGSLTKLDIQGNNIGDDGASAIAQAISEAASLALRTLYVPRGGVERHVGLRAACKARNVKLV